MSEVTLEQLKSQIAAAATGGDDGEFNKLIKEYNSRKAEVAKMLAEAARKESEALAGDREILAKSVHKAVTQIPNIADRLAEVKATGFTFKLNDQEQGITYKSVALTVPVIKERKAGTGTSATAKTGNTLEQDFEAHATQADKDAIAKIEAEVAAGTIDAKAANSQKWVVKNKVRKAAIASGVLQPVK